jgi:hypothetical protein
VILSTVTPTESRLLNAGVDFVAHATLAFLTSHLAMGLAQSGGWMPDASFGLPTGTIAVIGPITAAFTAGALGALQGSVSRHNYLGVTAGVNPEVLQPLPMLEPGN